MMKVRFGIVSVLLCQLANGQAEAADARPTLCGSGYILAVVLNVSDGGTAPSSISSATNIAFRLDNSISQPSSGAVMYSYAGSAGWSAIQYQASVPNNESRNPSTEYENIKNGIMSAYLSGTPIKLETSAVGNSCVTSSYYSDVVLCTVGTMSACGGGG